VKQASLLLRTLVPLSGEDARRRRGVARVGLYVGLLLAIGFVAALRSAHAEVMELSLAFGRDLLPLQDLLVDRARVSINGEAIWAASSLSSASLGEVLDRFEAHCHANGAGDETWGDVTSGEGSPPKAFDTRRLQGSKFDFGVLRSERVSEGAILCFVGAPDVAEPNWLDRMRRFVDTKDLSRLGRLRYAFARVDRGQTHVLAMWTDSHLRFDKLSGTDGTEPGFDNPDLPRPIRSSRTVSAAIDGTSYAVRGYHSDARPTEVLAAYTNEMVRRGWQVAPTNDAQTRGYLKDGSLVTVGTNESGQGGVEIGIAEMGVDPGLAPAVRSASVDAQ